MSCGDQGSGSLWWVSGFLEESLTDVEMVGAYREELHQLRRLSSEPDDLASLRRRDQRVHNRQRR